MSKDQMLAAVVAMLAIPAIASAHGGNNDSNMIHACIGNISKIARVVGVGGSCISGPPLLGETPAHWPRVQGTGPEGPKGDKGDQGEQGAPGVNGLNGIDGTSVTFAGYFDGNQNGCPNGGAIFAAGAVSVYVCNGANGGGGTVARADGPCFDNTNRYVDCGNGTVTDTVTGLIWLKQADCLRAADFASANRAAAALKSGDCAAHPLSDGSSPGDWRLPTRDEWRATIARAVALDCIYFGVGPAPALTNDAGTGCLRTGAGSSFAIDDTANLLLWSSTTSELYPTRVWMVTLVEGYDGVAPKFSTDLYPVWPVRGGSR